MPGYVFSRHVPPRRSAFSYTVMSVKPASRSLIALSSPAIPAPTTTKRGFTGLIIVEAEPVERESLVSGTTRGTSHIVAAGPVLPQHLSTYPEVVSRGFTSSNPVFPQVTRIFETGLTPGGSERPCIDGIDGIYGNR